MKNNCKQCGRLTKNKKFCSHSCHNNYDKKNNIGFFNSEFQSEMAKRMYQKHPNIIKEVNKEHKKNKTGFFDSKLQSMLGKRGGKRTHELHPNLASEMGKKNIRKSLETQRKKKIGFWNSKSQSRLGKISGPIVSKMLRKRKGYIFNKINFDSKSEMEIGICIHYQIEKLVEGKNYQKKVDSKSFDFFIKNYFIEYHPTLKFFNPNETEESYYKERRKVLNENGYKDYPLIVII